VEVTGGGKPYLKLHVNTVESIADVHETDFTPPVEAVNLKGKRLSGVILKPMQQPFPQWPTSLRQQHFSVTVEVVVGRDGHVVSAHAVSGPSEAYKSAEDTARRWTFQPYIVLDEPAEVETKIILSNN
jgi:outer membrane biosynthesis protein TonB